MAHFSLQCVDCRDRTKQCAGEYRGKDEQGDPFCGSMYLCENRTCQVNIARERSEKYLHRYDGYWPRSSRRSRPTTQVQRSGEP